MSRNDTVQAFDYYWTLFSPEQSQFLPNENHQFENELITAEERDSVNTQFNNWVLEDTIIRGHSSPEWSQFSELPQSL